MSLTIRLMIPADIPLGMKLKAQNGWNQLEGDWRRQLELEPAGCFVAELDGQGVGTACSSVFGTVAWVAMVLVDAGCRGRGIGTGLMKHVLEYLDGQGATSIRLDATPLGKPIYEKLGFAHEFTLHRYEGTATVQADPQEVGLAVSPVSVGDLSEIATLDRQVTGTDRTLLLERLFRDIPAQMRVVRDASGISGFIAARPGARAWHIGPCQGHPDACRQLLLDACRRLAGQPLFLDIPDANDEAVSLARELGSKVQRPLLRMGRGPTITENLDKFWTSYGPEKG